MKRRTATAWLGAFFWIAVPLSLSGGDPWAQAEIAAEAMRQAPSLREEKLRANRALAMALAEETPESPSELYRLIAELFLQSERYGWAILYLERALWVEPSDPGLREELQKIRSHWGIAAPETPLPLFSQREWMWISALFFALAFALALRRQGWGTPPPLRRAEQLFTWAGACAFAIGLIEHYAAPIWAVLIASSPLYPSASLSAPPASLLGEGSAVRVEHAVRGGTWLEVETVEGARGYVPASALRIVEP